MSPEPFSGSSPASSPKPVYLYSICARPDHTLPLPLGLAESTELVVVGEVAALVEHGVDLEGLQTDEHRLLNAVLSHDRVICELFQTTPLLPLRFGTQIASLDHLKHHLASQGADYAARLSTLGDRAEFQLKLSPHPLDLPPLAEGLGGRDYFLAKKQRLHAQTAAQEQQQQQLSDLLTTIHAAYPDGVEVPGSSGETKVYLLAARTAVADLAAQVEVWQSQAAHWHLVLSDPLPPYHFV